jgi:hypothetical protein
MVMVGVAQKKIQRLRRGAIIADPTAQGNDARPRIEDQVMSAGLHLDTRGMATITESRLVRSRITSPDPPKPHTKNGLFQSCLRAHGFISCAEC